jgi:hypothetical protein
MCLGWKLYGISMGLGWDYNEETMRKQAYLDFYLTI